MERRGVLIEEYGGVSNVDESRFQSRLSAWKVLLLQAIPDAAGVAVSLRRSTEPCGSHKCAISAW